MQPRRLSSQSSYSSFGSFNNRVTLLSQNSGRTTGGEFLPPVPFATVWASVTALQGSDLAKAQEVVAQVTHKVVLRSMPGVVSSMLVQLNARTFVIEAVQDQDERGVELVLLCRETNEGA